MWKVEKIVKKGEYDYAKVKNHPNATASGYILYHRVIVENHLKRLLSPNEVVHHLNHDRKDNRIENLQVMPSKEHSLLHGKERGRKWVKLKCPNCGISFERDRRNTHLTKHGKLNATFCSSRCRGMLSRTIQLRGITPEVERAISENILLEFRKYSRDNAEETETTGSVETIRTSPEMVKT